MTVKVLPLVLKIRFTIERFKTFNILTSLGNVIPKFDLKYVLKMILKSMKKTNKKSLKQKKKKQADT